MPPSDSLRRVREALVRRHTACENASDWAGAVATFHTPRYEVVATSEVHQGADAVSAFYAETAGAFPGFTLDLRALHTGDESVVAEVHFRGVQSGAWRGLPATGRVVEYDFAGIFLFEEERLVCERLYFDVLTQLRQIGIARDPTSLAGRIATGLNHPLVVGGAFVRDLRRR